MAFSRDLPPRAKDKVETDRETDLRVTLWFESNSDAKDALLTGIAGCTTVRTKARPSRDNEKVRKSFSTAPSWFRWLGTHSKTRGSPPERAVASDAML